MLLSQNKQTHKRKMQLPKKMALHDKRSTKEVIKIPEQQPLGDIIQNQIQWNLNHNIPHPTTCTITKIYNDNNHVDIKTQLYGELTYIQTHGKTPTINAEAILIFLNNNYEEKRVII